VRERSRANLQYAHEAANHPLGSPRRRGGRSPGSEVRPAPQPPLAATLFDQDVIKRWPWVGAAIGWIVFSLYWDAAAKKVAMDNEVSSYPMELQSGTGTRVANLAMPPKIKSGLMDGFH